MGAHSFGLGELHRRGSDDSLLSKVFPDRVILCSCFLCGQTTPLIIRIQGRGRDQGTRTINEHAVSFRNLFEDCDSTIELRAIPVTRRMPLQCELAVPGHARESGPASAQALAAHVPNALRT